MYTNKNLTLDISSGMEQYKCFKYLDIVWFTSRNNITGLYHIYERFPETETRTYDSIKRYSWQTFI